MHGGELDAEGLQRRNQGGDKDLETRKLGEAIAEPAR